MSPKKESPIDLSELTQAVGIAFAALKVAEQALRNLEQAADQAMQRLDTTRRTRHDENTNEA